MELGREEAINGRFIAQGTYARPLGNGFSWKTFAQNREQSGTNKKQSKRVILSSSHKRLVQVLSRRQGSTSQQVMRILMIRSALRFIRPYRIFEHQAKTMIERKMIFLYFVRLDFRRFDGDIRQLFNL
mgnify:CR=1 FL=1